MILKIKCNHEESEEAGVEGLRSGAEAEGISGISEGCCHQINMRLAFPHSAVPLEGEEWSRKERSLW